MFLSLLLFFSFTAAVLKQGDFDMLCGDAWKGTLTYINYSNCKEVTIPSKLNVLKLNDTTYVFATSFPEEPQANQMDTVRFLKKGTYLDKEKVMIRSLKHDTLRIITEQSGTVNDTPAIFRHTYILSKHYFMQEKKEKKEKEFTYKVRNRYEFRR